MIIVAILASLLPIGFGIMMLAFPDTYRAWNKFGNDLEGVKTEHGETFEMGRIVGGVFAIIAGIMLLFLIGGMMS